MAKVATFPVVAGALFVANPFALYLTGWYEATLRNPLLHDLNHLHFLLVGALWFWPILGLDPMPVRLAHPLRLVAVFATMPFHAFLGVAIMGSSTLLAGDYYAALGRTWGPSLERDQEIAGGPAVGERRPGGAGRARRAVRAVGPGLRARGRAGGPAAGPARGGPARGLRRPGRAAGSGG